MKFRNKCKKSGSLSCYQCAHEESHLSAANEKFTHMILGFALYNYFVMKWLKYFLLHFHNCIIQIWMRTVATWTTDNATATTIRQCRSRVRKTRSSSALTPAAVLRSKAHMAHRDIISMIMIVSETTANRHRRQHRRASPTMKRSRSSKRSHCRLIQVVRHRQKATITAVCQAFRPSTRRWWTIERWDKCS